MVPDRDDPALAASSEGVPPGVRPSFLTIRRLMLLVALAIVLALLVFFVADNFVLVQIRVFTLRIQARLAWAVIVPLVAGFGLGWLAHALHGGWQGWRRRNARG